MWFSFGERKLDLSVVQVMGILNVTPDSFSDGGRYRQLDVALQHVEQMLAHGATIIDIGGESTRPNAEVVSSEQELERVVPIVEALSSRFDAVLSVDTSTPEVMLEAHKAGVHLLNDVRSLTRPGALAAALHTGLPICLMHMQGEPQIMQENPQYHQPIEEAVLNQLQTHVQRCIQAGIAQDKLLIDPGFGFGKNTQHNYRLLNRLASLQQLNLPILAGLSRKRMIADATGQQVAAERLMGSVAGAVLCAQQGARIIRVHDVQATVEAMQVVNATIKEGYV